MKFFIAGIMQGSFPTMTLHGQNYRKTLKSAIQQAFPDAEVYDPFENHPESKSYSHEKGKCVFLTHNKMCGADVDVLVAFIPEASMGTAIEIWEAWKNGAVVLMITPMTVNWVVSFLSDAVFTDIDAFCKALASGEIADIINRQVPRAAKRSCDDFIPHA